MIIPYTLKELLREIKRNSLTLTDVRKAVTVCEERIAAGKSKDANTFHRMRYLEAIQVLEKEERQAARRTRKGNP